MGTEGSSPRALARIVFLIVVLSILTLACGGGGGGGNSTGGANPIIVLWAALPNDDLGPASARSMKLELDGSGAGLPSVSVITVRPAADPQAVQTYAYTQSPAPGEYQFRASFYRDANAVGKPLAVASGTVLIGANDTGMPPLTNVQQAASLAVTVGQDVFVVEERRASATARDTAMRVVALPENSIEWTVSAGADRLQIVENASGTFLKGVAVGEASVSASHGEITSVAEKVQVLEGAAIGAEGGTVETDEGKVKLVIPAGALAAPTRITIGRPVDFPPSEQLVSSTVHRFGPDGLKFSQPANLTISYSQDAVPMGTDEESLDLVKAIGNTWQSVPGSIVDTVADQVTAPLNGFSDYGVGGGGGTVGGPKVYVVDVIPPGSADHFKQLPQAITAVVSRLGPEDIGTVEVQTDRVLNNKRLVIPARVRIIAGEGKRVRLGNDEGSVVVDASNNFSAVGWNVSASGAVFNVAGRIEVLDCNIPGFTRINILDETPGTTRVGALRGGLVDGLTSPDLEVNGSINDNLTVSTSVLDNLKLTLEGEAGAEAELRTLQGMESVTGDVTATADVKLTADLLETKIWNWKVRGSATVDADFRATTAEQGSFEANAKTTFKAEVMEFQNLGFSLKPDGDLDVSLTSPTISEKLNILGTEARLDAKCAFDVDGGSLMEVAVDAKCKAELQMKRLTLGAEATVKARAGFTGGMLDLQAPSANFNLELYEDLSLNGGVGLTANNATIAGIGLAAKTAAGKIGAGVFVTNSRIGFDGFRHSAIDMPRQSRRSGRAPTGGVIEIVDTVFETGSQPGVFLQSPPTETLERITIENCQFTNTHPFSMLIHEADTAVTINGNTINGGGIGIAGDMEGEGRSGILNRPYVIQGNTLNIAGSPNAISLQDVTGATIQSNQISGFGISVSAGKVFVKGNTISGATIPLITGEGPNGPGYMIADTGNEITGGLIVSGLRSFMRLNDNTLTGVMVNATPGILEFNGNTCSGVTLNDGNPASGGLPTDPSGNGGLNKNVQLNSATDWDGNDCADYPTDTNRKDEDGDCLKQGVAPPPGNWPP